MRFIIYAIASLLLFALLIVLGMFVNGSTDIFGWPEEGRFFVVWLWGVISAMGIGIAESNRRINRL